MKRTKLFFMGCLWMAALLPVAGTGQQARQYFLLKTWWCQSAEQVPVLEDYLAKVYLPLVHKQGIGLVGVFIPAGQDTMAQKRVIAFIPVGKLERVEALEKALEKQDPFADAGHPFADAPANAPAFLRVETVLLKAFAKMPGWKVPSLSGPPAERIYELRSYEGASEALYRRKVDMFNAGGEIALFARLGFNAVFYGQVLAGARMPNLMYMTSFENMQERDAHWNTFRVDPEWKNLSAMPQYKGTVSRSDIILLKASGVSEW